MADRLMVPIFRVIYIHQTIVLYFEVGAASLLNNITNRSLNCSFPGNPRDVKHQHVKEIFYFISENPENQGTDVPIFSEKQ